MTLSFKTLRDANASRQREWDSGNVIDLAYRGNELAGEVGEACNVIKKLERERHGIRGSRATMDDLAQELADVIICTDLIAHAAGIDLGKAVAEKFNATSEKVGLATIIMLPGVDYQAKAETEQQHLNDADNFGAPVSDHYQVGAIVRLDALVALYAWWDRVDDGVTDEKGLRRCDDYLNGDDGRKDGLTGWDDLADIITRLTKGGDQ